MQGDVMQVLRDVITTLAPPTLYRYLLTISAFTKIAGRECDFEVYPNWTIGKDIYGDDKTVELSIQDGQLVILFDGDQPSGPAQKRYDQIRVYCEMHGLKYDDPD